MVWDPAAPSRTVLGNVADSLSLSASTYQTSAAFRLALKANTAAKSEILAAEVLAVSSQVPFLTYLLPVEAKAMYA